MGHQGSKSPVEARVTFHRFGAADVCQRTDPCSAPAPVVRIQRRAAARPARLHSPARAPEKPSPHAWPRSRCDAGGLVYVMDNPTGGVWVKPEENWTRS